MVYILHIDTSAEKAVTAISGDGKILAQVINEDNRSQAANINAHIEQVLNEAGIELRDINAVSVIGGPGSYTGLRIGLATAKGICYTLDKPLILYNKLDILALQLCSSAGSSYDYYLTILPARDKEYFMTVYNNNGRQIFDPGHIFEAELMAATEQYKNRLLVSGLLNKTIIEMLTKENIEYRENELIDVGFWSHISFRSYNDGEFANLANSEPFYLKQVYTHNRL